MQDPTDSVGSREIELLCSDMAVSRPPSLSRRACSDEILFVYDPRRPSSPLDGLLQARLGRRPPVQRLLLLPRDEVNGLCAHGAVRWCTPCGPQVRRRDTPRSSPVGLNELQRRLHLPRAV
ncbi:hypothetical protein VPH35_077353 [Triticum aestivum]